MSQDPERIPVIVGVGEYLDRPENPDNGLHSRGLMQKALEAADADAGGGWLADIESLSSVDQISWPQLGKQIVEPLAAAFGAKPKYRFTTEQANGDSPILLLNEAANMIGEGKVKVAAIVGGEALRTAAYFAKKAAEEGHPTDTSVAAISASRTPPYRRRYGLNAPVDVYPLYENAGRSAYGQTLAEGQAESGEIWSRFADVAKQTDGAWLRKGATSQDIQTPSPSNRPIAHPYNKLMVANSSVNQGAGYIVASLAEARRRGVPDEKLVYIGLGAAAHESDDPLQRDRYDRSISMTTSISKTMELNGLKTSDLDFVELYSCFPCVPKMARRVLDWPLNKPATVFGGLTFGGGPIGNYMAHAVVNMVKKLRQEGTYGLLFANGGFATHNHTIVLSNQAMDHAVFPQTFDFQAEADSKRETIPDIDEDFEGEAAIETFTVLYDREGNPRHGVIVALTPEGKRTLAKVPAEDASCISFLTDGDVDPVGSTGEISLAENGDHIWRRKAS